MSVKPEISVIMSVYNGEMYLVEAIESVINQTFKNWELIVINDCSTDSTNEILADFAARDERIKVTLNEVNLRLPKSLNKAISLCTGKYIARMDADDICLPDRFEKQFEFMEKHSDVSLATPRFMTMKNGVFASGGCGGRRDSEALKAMLLVTNPIIHPGVIVRAEVIKKFLYDPTFTCTEDLELWTRMAMANCKMAAIPECLLLYRLHDKQITSTSRDRQNVEVLKIQQKYYSFFGEGLDEKFYDFYINGIYFKDNTDVDKFLEFSKWLKKYSKNHFKKESINYALFEILAEYKRKSVSNMDIIKAIFSFNPFFVIKEMVRRKKDAKKDIEKCTEVAKYLGLQHTTGTKKYPIFEK